MSNDPMWAGSFLDVYRSVLWYPTRPAPADGHPGDEQAIVYAKGEPAGQYLRGFEPLQIRATVAQIAAHSAGMRAGPDEPHRTEYLDLVAPGEKGQRRQDMASMSGCALCARAWLRLAGVVHPRLFPPYLTGFAFADLVTLASPHPWAYVTGYAPPDRGVFAVFGRGRRTHIALIWQVKDGWALTVDGGQQTNRGAQTILWRRRRVDQVPAGPGKGRIRAFEDRDVLYWIDPARLAPLMRLQWRYPFRSSTPLPIPPSP